MQQYSSNHFHLTLSITTNKINIDQLFENSIYHQHLQTYDVCKWLNALNIRSCSF